MQKTSRTMMGLLGAAAIGLGIQQANAGGGSGANTDVTADIAGDTTWYSTSAADCYTLTKPIYVTNGATLTVEAGTVIRGEPESSPGQFDPGTLIVARGSKIRMLGERSKPIVMTDLSDDHYIGPKPTAGANSNYAMKHNGFTGKWGGLILLGKTYVAYGTTADHTFTNAVPVERAIEGLVSAPEGKYGGREDNDDSGEVHYLSIRYGGFNLSANNEINGLTLGAVGRQTKIDHVEVHQTKDDSFEMFGGTVNMKYLFAFINGDDGFDTDEGFRGKGQFLSLIQGPMEDVVNPALKDVSDKGSEQDGGNGDDKAQPSTIATIYNATLVGLGKNTKTQNTALSFRDGAGSRWYNSVFVDFGGACALVEGTSVTNDSKYEAGDNTEALYTKLGGPGNVPVIPDPAATPGFIGYDHTPRTGKRLEVVNSLFWNFGCTNSSGVPIEFGCAANSSLLGNTWGAEGSDGNKAFTDPTWANTYLADGSMMPIMQLQRSATPITISTVNYYPVECIDEHPVKYYNGDASDPFYNSTKTPPNDGFFTVVDYYGAFDSGRDWRAGWTLAYRKGILGKGAAVDNGPAIDLKSGNADSNKVTSAQMSTTPVKLNVWSGSKLNGAWADMVLVRLFRGTNWQQLANSGGTMQWVSWNTNNLNFAGVSGSAPASLAIPLTDMDGVALPNVPAMGTGKQNYYAEINTVLDGLFHLGTPSEGFDTLPLWITP